MNWEVVDDEMPPTACRRCQAAWYADEDADAEARKNVRSPRSAVVHIEREEWNDSSLARMTAATLLLMRGARTTYCGLEIARD